MRNKILISAVAILFLFNGCGDNKKEEATQNEAQQKVEMKQEAQKSEATQAVEKAANVVKESVNKAAQTAKEAVNKVEKAAKEATQKAKEAATAATNAVKNAVSNEEGKRLFAKCAGCHGKDGKTKALGKSAPIAGLPADQIVKDLEGYKAGTLNKHGMGTLMKGQVANLTDDQIKALAEFISSLK